jgi:hypothetical protein
MMTTTELLSRAKRAIESGEASLRAAAEDLAAVQEQGATQREIAEAVGKSLGWVHRLLAWKRDGYREATPFGAQSAESRRRQRRVQSNERASRGSPDADANSATTNCDDDDTNAEAETTGHDPNTLKPHAERPSRDLLVKALGMLGSDHEGERAVAALMADKERRKFGRTWDELIVAQPEAH